MKNWSRVLTVIIVGAMLLLMVGCGGQQSAKPKYPDKSIDMVIPWPAGGSSDLAARTMAKMAEKELGVAITPINVAGSNGAMGWAEAAKRKPDGYSIALVTFDILSNQALKTSKINYDDFEYILQFTEQPFGIMVHGDSPVKTIEDLVKAAKANPNLKMGSTPLGGVYHQAIALFEQKAGIKFAIVPFKGSPDENAALLGKHLDAQLNTMSVADQHIKQGTLRLLAVTAEKRMPDYPDVPTLKERGFDVVYGSWRAIGIPKGAPADVKAKLVDAFTKAYNGKEFQEIAKKSKFEPHFRNAADFDKHLKALYPEVEKVLNAMKVLK